MIDLKEYTDTRIDALDTRILALFEEKQKALDAALIAQKEAVAKAENATDRIAARGQADLAALQADMAERLVSVRRELESANNSAKEAVTKAETATEKRLEGMNEFRATLTDQTKSFIPREVAEGVFTDLRNQIDRISSRVIESGGREQGTSRAKDQAHQASIAQITLVMAVIAILAVIVTAVIHFIPAAVVVMAAL